MKVSVGGNSVQVNNITVPNQTVTNASATVGTTTVTAPTVSFGTYNNGVAEIGIGEQAPTPVTLAPASRVVADAAQTAGEQLRDVLPPLPPQGDYRLGDDTTGAHVAWKHK